MLAHIQSCPNSDQIFRVYDDRSARHSGSGEHEFAAHVMRTPTAPAL
jgi:hypothetical protein